MLYGGMKKKEVMSEQEDVVLTANAERGLPKTSPISKRTVNDILLELELELIQTQMAQKPMLRAEVGMRVRCANKASAE
jgi:hypothetical protein